MTVISEKLGNELTNLGVIIDDQYMGVGCRARN